MQSSFPLSQRWQQTARTHGGHDSGRSRQTRIKVNVVTLDFPSLIERISQKFNYEAAMLGFRNVELDPIVR